LTGFGADEIEDILGDGGAGGDADRQRANGALREAFLAPPFSVLNAREGRWQDRKEAWLAIGIQSELGRGEESKSGVLFRSLSGRVPDYYTQKTKKEKELGRKIENKEFEEKYLVIGDGTIGEKSTSIFDPVLCELAYSWFSPPGGLVLDPFAGGSVRGVVASKLGRVYCGVELRPDQVEENREQARLICGDPAPVWHYGDSAKIDKICEGVKADLVFSCPPYADLEVYSDDPADISNMEYDDFLAAYRLIIKKTCALLKEDRFACFVVGDIRDKKGNYRNFVGDTVSAFVDAGLSLYNDAVLVTCVGSLAIRVGRQFAGGRKLGKAHQNVLVFVKGDGKRAAEAMGDVFIDEGLLYGQEGADEEDDQA
jgi:hypothetical protein